MKGTAHQHQKAVRSLGAQAILAPGTVDGVGVNRVGFEEALVDVDVGVLGGANTLDFKAQESDDDVTYADIPGAVFPQFTSAANQKRVVGRLNLINRKKFIRLQVVIVAPVPAGQFQGGFILSQATRFPVAQVEPVAFNIN